ncbi:MAG: family 10 glycosylhydrolase, partial [Pirellulales bacterium]|nr:family 10 glycosylhydrolase [Pirellulales bacterium]
MVNKHRRWFFLFAPAVLCSNLLAASPRNNVVPSWGDFVVAFGPGTDPAMDSPEAVQNMIKHWQGRGHTGIYLRTDLVQLDPSMIRRNPVVQPNPRLAHLWNHIDGVMESFDAHQVGHRFAESIGFEFWAWHPHIYSDGAPENAGAPGAGRMVPWSYGSAYTYQHPEAITVDRKGNKLWMVPEYAYPGARAAKVAEFVHMAKTGVKRFIACMRSEVLQLQDAPDKADRFGFGEPVVREMQRRHGVDILTDPRFDVDRADFNPRDPMVEAWHNLRGEHVTQLYRELRRALREVDPQIRLAVTLSGDHVGPPMGNWRLDWRTWVDEGLVDEIIAPVSFEATIDHEANKKGYLTNVLAGVGTVPYATLRSYIDRSPHPEIKIIATGAYPYFFKPPPAGTDGWRSDAWYDAYHMAWRQRWQQWMKDLKEFGHIKFLKQDFDAAEVPEHGRLEAWGCFAYNPKVRS